MTTEQILFEDVETSGAYFSDDGKYRYELWRKWDASKPLLMVIGLNPSTANHKEDDPTIRCVIKFSKVWGYGGFYMMNLFAFISSKPQDLLTCNDPVGNNDYHLEIIAGKCKDVLFAWGNFKQASQRREVIIKKYPEALCIGSKNGHPFHPLWAGVYAKDKSQFIKPVKFTRPSPTPITE